jgi:hypothetical protein
VGTPWSARPAEKREEYKEYKRKQREERRLNGKTAEYEREYRRRCNIRSLIQADIAFGKTTSQIMEERDLSYEDVSRIREGKLPKPKPDDCAA